MKAIVLAAFILAFLSAPSLAFQGLGENCNYTYDCAIGYCASDSKTCINPPVSRYAVGSQCIVTADCKEGYCSTGKCIVPITEAANILAFGPKNGCAGLADASALGSLVIICDILWVLLIIFSLMAGFVAREEENRIVPVVSVLLPLVVGTLIFVFVGILIAIVEIALIFYKREKKSADYAELPKELLTPPPA